MNRIDKTFATLKDKGEKALVGFVSAGDPDPEKSLKLISAMCDGGLDILELGIPFSDPTADGPVIQRSSARALKSGTRLSTVLDMSRELRKKTEIPIILFSYYNPIHYYGPEKFCRDAQDAGADGVLVVDLPPEESQELTRFFDKDRFSIIRLVAPTTSEARMQTISDTASGFIYLVSKTGVTGSDGLDTREISSLCGRLKSLTDLPVCIGFGISTAEDVAAIARVADGVVIGSAFERMIENNFDNPELCSILYQKVREYKKATL
ncbi:MAG: tryptophan synthase subunit alpha [Proteobacteria bacterium]|nr:tryptophan synthase subunit alpha [Pseudomonadota bacterium]